MDKLGRPLTDLFICNLKGSSPCCWSFFFCVFFCVFFFVFFLFFVFVFWDWLCWGEKKKGRMEIQKRLDGFRGEVSKQTVPLFFFFLFLFSFFSFFSLFFFLC